jgi:DNA-binding NarL/FixJ family response regulator
MNGSGRIGVYIANDLKLDLDVTEALLKAYSDEFQVVGKNESLPKAIEEISDKKPEVVLMDVSFKLRDMDGIPALQAVKKRSPKVRFIMITVYDAPEAAAEAHRSGAEGFLYHGSTAQRLMNAIRAVHSGLRVWDSRAMQNAQEWSAWERKGGLTPSERRLLVVLARDPCSNAELAKRLGMNERAVEEQLQHIMEKVNIHRRDKLVAWARDNLRLIP